MVKVQIGEVSLYLDGTLKTILDSAKEYVEHNFDMVGLITGSEGSGKSTLAVQLCYYLDPGFNLDKVVFNPEQFYKAIDQAPPGSAILWDESDSWSASWSSRIVQTLKQTFKRIRSKRLYIILATPTYFDLGRYMCVHRSRFLINCYTNGFQRGNFSFFNQERKQYLYFKGIKYWDMQANEPNFRGSFTNLPIGFPIDMSSEGAYETKKQEATKELMSSKKNPTGDEAVYQFKLDCVQRGDEAELKDALIALILGVHPRTIRTYRSQLRKQLGISLEASTPSAFEAGKQGE